MRVNPAIAWNIGCPPNYGRHTLLSYDDLYVLWRVLQCHKCCVRRLYHVIASRELVTTKSGWKYTSSSGIRISTGGKDVLFHNVSRAIRAVLYGYEQRISKESISTLLQISTVSSAQSSSSSSTQIIRCGHLIGEQVLKSFDASDKYKLVCWSHGRELFELLYRCSADESLSIPGQGCCAAVHAGHSNFYRSLRAFSLFEAHSATSVSGCTISAIINAMHTSLHLPGTVDTSQSLSIDESMPISSTSHMGVRIVVESSFPNSQNSVLRQICQVAEANAKWSAFYDEVVQRKECGTSASHVHFPIDNPVTSVHNLVTYAMASKLERRNRVWETAARYRCFEKYCRLIHEGLSPMEAAQSAEGSDSTDEDQVENKLTCVPTGLTSHVDVAPLASQTLPTLATQTTKKRKRKRNHRKQSQRRIQASQTTSSIVSNTKSSSVHICPPEICEVSKTGYSYLGRSFNYDRSGRNFGSRTVTCGRFSV